MVGRRGNGGGVKGELIVVQSQQLVKVAAQPPLALSSLSACDRMEVIQSGGLFRLNRLNMNPSRIDAFRSPLRTHNHSRLPWALACLAGLFALMGTRPETVCGQGLESVELNNGMILVGTVGSVKEVKGSSATANAARNLGIFLISDELRDTLVSRRNIFQINPTTRQEETFQIWQDVHNDPEANASPIGEILGIGPFDEFGRRSITTMTYRGPETVLQGITEINPRYVRVEGIKNRGPEYPEMGWDMRLAINAVPTRVLIDVLHNNIRDRDNANDRLRLVDFFVQAQKYRQAEDELLSVERDFPGLRAELAERRERIRGQVALQMLDEVRQRAEAGQPNVANMLLQPLLEKTNLAAAVLVEIRQTAQELQAPWEDVEATRQLVEQAAERVVASEEIEGNLKDFVTRVSEEIVRDLRPSNADRLATFVRLESDPDQSDLEKLCLALSGWQIGSGNAVNNAGLADSIDKSRTLVREYLVSSSERRRKEILTELGELEGGAVRYLDLILKHVLPPLAPSQNEIVTDKPMEIPIELEGSSPLQTSYLIQLPPEYDPYRRYPCVLALGASSDAYTTPEAEIDWWAGPANERFGFRLGYASRNGYIVIAPRWTRDGQQAYEFSRREHAIILKALRDAQKRFSIDTDRVFLSGHFEGATAAWDIGQSHPEHFAGVIPITARARTYINHTFGNARYNNQWYFVNGGRDFASRDANENVWNKWMQVDGYQTVIVLYRGRGTERFSDELPNLFQWMAPQRRNFAVSNFRCSTMRPFNNYFWWLELDLTDNPKMLPPEKDWNSVSRSDWEVEGELKRDQNRIQVRGTSTGASATVWLSPEIIDFSRDIEIQSQGGRDFNDSILPCRKTILEDARRRGDRQHPWWARVNYDGRNWAPEVD